MKKTILSIDAMGGDNAPGAVLEGILIYLKKYNDCEFLLFGDKDKLNRCISKMSKKNASLIENTCKFYHTSDNIGSSDDPINALRKKKDSSLRKAVEAVSENKAAAVLSSGNTGAYIAICKYVIKMLGDMKRPAITRIMPTKKSGDVVCMDLGANSDCTAENLHEFAIIGNIMAKVSFNKNKPKVGILNIGTEEIKGTKLVQDAYKIIKEDKTINFKGFVEPQDVVENNVDVCITDGFTGNIFLKSLESGVKFMAHILKRSLTKTIFRKFINMFNIWAFWELKKKTNPDNYNGALLLGLNGVAVKSHGAAGAKSFFHSIHVAKTLAQSDLLDQIKKSFKKTQSS